MSLKDLLNPPDEATQAEILRSCEEDPDRFRHHLLLLEKWMSTQDQLPKTYDKNVLVTFLRGCKQDMARAKSKIENYYAARSRYPYLFRDRVLTMEGDINALTYTIQLPLPVLTPEGYRITVFKLSNSDLDVFNITEVIRCTLILTDIRIHRDPITAGDVLIYATENATAAHAVKYVSPQFKAQVDFILKACPSRLKQIHIITSQAYVVSVVNVLKQLLPEKIRKRFYMHKDWESLKAYFPRKLLPSEFGGSTGSCAQLVDEWKKALVENGEWIRALGEAQIKDDVPKHSDPASADHFGIDGSFRRLDID